MVPKRIVKVTWVDSSSPVDRVWMPSDEAAKPTRVDCITVGYLLYEDEENLVLVSGVAPTDDKGSFDVSGVTTIPQVAVAKIEDLRVSRKKTP